MATKNEMEAKHANIVSFKISSKNRSRQFNKLLSYVSTYKYLQKDFLKSVNKLTSKN